MDSPGFEPGASSMPRRCDPASPRARRRGRDSNPQGRMDLQLSRLDRCLSGHLGMLMHRGGIEPPSLRWQRRVFAIGPSVRDDAAGRIRTDEVDRPRVSNPLPYQARVTTAFSAGCRIRTCKVSPPVVFDCGEAGHSTTLQDHRPTGLGQPRKCSRRDSNPDPEIEGLRCFPGYNTGAGRRCAEEGSNLRSPPCQGGVLPLDHRRGYDDDGWRRMESNHHST